MNMTEDVTAELIERIGEALHQAPPGKEAIAAAAAWQDIVSASAAGNSHSQAIMVLGMHIWESAMRRAKERSRRKGLRK